jgi:dienelactone hydrolase
MLEEAVRIGPSGDLVGIVTPAVSDRGAGVGCLLFNSGVIHRVGPHRINVKLARALSAAGIPSLRMDLSGLGDSATSGESAGVQAQAVRDLQDGISALATLARVERVIVIGICSGAVSAYDVALADDRVQGLLMFDGFTFPTTLTHVIRRWRRFRTTPLRAFPAWLLKVVRPAKVEEKRDELTTPAEQKPSRQAFGAAVERLLSRGVSVCIVYSGSFLEKHNYSRQLAHAFHNADFLRHIRYAYLPAVDHTLTPLDAQRTFVNLVVDWAGDAVKARSSPSEHVS